MSIENTTSKLLHSRGVLCVVKPYTAPTGNVASDGCYRHVAPLEQSSSFGCCVG